MMWKLITLLVSLVSFGRCHDTIINVNSGHGCDDETVAFSVGSTAGFAPTKYSRVPMNVEWVNIGGHFDMSTAVFTVPIAGLYSCFFGASSASGGKMVFIGLHIGNPEPTTTYRAATSVAYDYNAKGHGTAAGSEVRLLKKGDKVSMWARGSGGYMINAHNPPSTRFSCFLIKKME